MAILKGRCQQISIFDIRCWKGWRTPSRLRRSAQLLQQTYACGHSTSQRVRVGATTSGTGHYYRGRTAPFDNDDGGRGSRYFAPDKTHPSFDFQDSPLPDGVLRVTLGCDPAPSLDDPQVSLENARSRISGSLAPSIICRSSLSLCRVPFVESSL